MRKFYLLLFVLLVGLLALTRTGFSADAAAIEKAALKPASVKVGEQFCLVIDYRLPAGAKLDRSATLKNYAGFNVSAVDDAPGRLTLSMLNDRLQGYALPVRLSYAGKASGELKAGDLRLKVAPRQNLKELKPIKDILPTRPWIKILLGLVLVAGLGLLGWLAWRLYNRLRKPPYVPVEAPARKALRRLNEIEPIFKSDQKLYYFEFTAVVREYLGHVRGLPAVEMTSEELKRVLTTDEDRLIVKVLAAADLIKFADATAAPERQAEELKLIRAYIDATAPGEVK